MKLWELIFTFVINTHHMKILRSLLIIVCLASGMKSHSQTGKDYPVRIEIAANSDDESHKIVTCGDVGLIMFFQSIEKVNDTLVKWYFSLYDKDLRLKWMKSIPVPSVMTLKEARYKDDQVTLFFLSDKEKIMRFQLIRMAVPGGTFTGNNGILPSDAVYVSLDFTGNTALIGYNLKNESAKVRTIDLVSGKNADYSWSEGIHSSLTGMTYDTVTAKIHGYLKKQWVKNKYEYFFEEMDLSGKITREIMISDNMSERYILDLKTVSLDRLNMIAYGGYSTSLSKNAGRNLYPPPATGFYFFKISGLQVQKTTFINFLSMSNAAFAGDREIGSLKKKAAKKERQVEYSLDYPLLVHGLLRYKDDWLMMAETFSPQFHLESYTDFDFYGRPYTNSFKVFDGYRFSRGILAGIDSAGNYSWDNSIEVMNLVSFELTPKINLFLPGEDRISLSYLGQGKVGYKIIDGNKTIETLDFSPVEMMNPEDKLLEETKSNMTHWYDNYFLCSGYQQIKNINKSENKKRIVFYFEKIKFQ